MLYGKIITFFVLFSTCGLYAAPKTVRFEFFDPKPLQKASFRYFRKRQDFQGGDFMRYSDLGVGGLEAPPPSQIIQPPNFLL